ncbi:MAG: metal ABC transporter substrate-binding protein [Succinivibrio dextrinosolvens]|nr:metal ABC transporter substrate-binding protein [Succinivibrio dextrinosolvens]MDY6420829.1 metal ABC transporter substrate-binding protein [Succinivibrio dextrinosolvens]MDY6466892.1 metal ABC transporter substrate-binding protein [Succinivibrio dextrinosolvens]MDY6471062.1 metal ABC transporter substrate-binding protein [Succinivibrio dextrinosolvens]
MFFHKLKSFLALTSGIAILTCSQNVMAKELNIIATNFPQYDFVKNITKDKANVTMLLKIGAEAHSYEPTPKDLIAIEKSDLFVYNGGENDEWIENFLKDNLSKLNSFAFTKEVSLRAEEEVEGMQPEAEEEHEDGEEQGFDEHVWTSPKNDEVILNKLCEAIVKLDPENKDYYEKNASDYINRFKELDQKYSEVISTSKNKTLVFGDRFPLLYFAKDYGLNYYAAFKGCSNETEVSASTIKFLIDKAEQLKAPVIFKIELSSDNIASTIAESVNAKVMTFNSGHNITVEEFKAGRTMADLFSDNIPALKEALN